MRQLTLDKNPIAWLERAEKDEKYRKRLANLYKRNFTHRCPICGRRTRFAICTKCRKEK